MESDYHRSKERELIKKAEEALFELQKHTEKYCYMTYQPVYRVRCELGHVENMIREMYKRDELKILVVSPEEFDDLKAQIELEGKFHLMENRLPSTKVALEWLKSIGKDPNEFMFKKVEIVVDYNK